ncbi:MAG: hypothetical protein O3A95_10985 [Planctomycetota bacterium]|nr:hypothetical protein [Planctomycetota bacterium]
MHKQEEPKVLRLCAEVPANLTLTDLDGRSLSMKELRGKTVVICWSAIYSDFVDVAQSHSEDGLRYLTVLSRTLTSLTSQLRIAESRL